MRAKNGLLKPTTFTSILLLVALLVSSFSAYVIPPVQAQDAETAESGQPGIEVTPEPTIDLGQEATEESGQPGVSTTEQSTDQNQTQNQGQTENQGQDETNAQSLGETETPAFAWKLELKVPIDNGDLQALGGAEAAAESLRQKIYNSITDKSVEFGVQAQSGAQGVSFDVALLGKNGLSQLRQVMFQDLASQVNYTGGVAALSVSGTATAGNQTQLIVETNPSTGYIWSMANIDAAMMVEGQTEFQSRGNIVGAPLKYIVNINQVGDGQTSFEMSYKRPWESQQVTRKLSIDTTNLPDVIDLSDPNVQVGNTQSQVEIGSLSDFTAQTLPTSFDWRTTSQVTSVKDQASCGSCWAFSAVGAMEAAVLIKTGTTLDLSEQYLVSCNQSGWSCNGGWWAHDYHINAVGKYNNPAGAVMESELPYTATNGSCSKVYNHPYKLTSWASIAGQYATPSVDAIKNAIYTYGPISVALCAGNSFSNYSGGVFATNESSYCGGGINHAVVLTGWDDSTQTWVMKNSWGTGWGESGYMRIRWGVSNIGYSANYVIYNGGTNPTPVPTATKTPTTTPPTAATAVSPTGTITATNPSFSWTSVGSAAYYYLWVDGPSGNVLKQWYTPTQAACSGGTCSVTPTLNLSAGSYSWKVQTYNAGGYGPWSNILSFAVTVPGPGTAVLISPTGTIATTTPTYTWNPATDASYYYLQVNNGVSNIIQTWYTAAQLGCSTGTCSINPSSGLASGDYSWRVQTWGNNQYGAWSDYMTFSIPVPQVPDTATLVSPTGLQTTTKPSYTWNVANNATWYYLWVDGPAGNVYKQWFMGSTYCNQTTCTVSPNQTLTAGNYSWKIQTYAAAGYGAWSEVMAFSIPAPQLPAASTLVSPTGTIEDTTPDFVWNPVVDATYYYYELSGASGTLFRQWYSNSICTDTACTIASPATLAAGSYTWRVETWNAVGFGPWSDTMSFEIPAPKLPDAATLVSPTGTIEDTKPNFIWNPVADATYYYYELDGASGPMYRQWYSNSICSVTACTLASPLTLSIGSYSWKVQTWSPVGFGPWSSTMTFDIPAPVPPAKPTLVSPTGTQSETTPSFTWNAVDKTDYYYLEVLSGTTKLIQQWYSTTQLNCATTCVASPGRQFASGSYTWTVMGYNSGGFGPASDAMTFTIPAPPAPGKPTLIAPNGTIQTKQPSYSWNVVNGATYYLLSVYSATTPVISQWVTSSQAACSTTCAYKPNKNLTGGSYTWTVTAWSSTGMGPASDAMSFTVEVPTPPGTVTLVEPTGSQTTTRPRFTWNHLSTATWYYFFLSGPSPIAQWVTAEDFCSNGVTCQAWPGSALRRGNYNWYIRAYNSQGYGPWSGPLSFSIVAGSASSPAESPVLKPTE